MIIMPGGEKGLITDDEKGFTGNTLLRRRREKDVAAENGFDFEDFGFMDDPLGTLPYFSQIESRTNLHQSMLFEFQPKKPITPRKESLSASALASAPRYRNRPGLQVPRLSIPIPPHRKSSLDSTQSGSDTGVSDLSSPELGASRIKHMEMIKYKIECGGEKIVVRLLTESFDELLHKVQRKLRKEDVSLYYRDEDNEVIRIMDREDLSHAGRGLLAVTSMSEDGEDEIESLVSQYF
jgi:hypothetical protein